MLNQSRNSTRLGDLLVQAGILTQLQLSEAARSAKAKRIQIGQALVMNGVISPRDLQSVLEAQSNLRDKSVEPAEALRCLKIAYKLGASFKDILAEYVSPKQTQTSKLGELLVESGLVSYEVLAKAVEQSYSTGLPLGRMLVLHETISNDLLTLALDLQVRVRDEMMSRQEALTAIRAAAGMAPIAPGTEETKPAPAPEGPRKKGLRIGELMVMAGVLTETDVMNALEWGLVNHQTIGKVLISQNLVSQTLLDAALSLQKMVDQENFEAAKASECLARIHGTGIALEEALAEIREEKVAKDGEVTYEKLLMLARVVSEQDLEAAFDISAQSATVIGKILVLTGHMDVPTLQATLRCYQLFSRGLLGQDDAVVTLDYSLHQNSEGPIKFDDALKELGWNKDRGLRLKGEPTPVVEQPPSIAAPKTSDSADSAATESEAKDTDAVIILPESQPVLEDTENIPEMPADQSVSDIGLSADDDEDSEDSKDGDDSENQDGSQSEGEGAKQSTKAKKHSQTIQPEDARASRLATLMQGHKQGERDLLANFDPTNDPPDALHKVFERLAASYFTRGNYTQAQVIYERILVHRLNQVGTSDTALVADFNNLAGVLVAQEKYNQAEPFMRRAVSILDVAKEAEPLKVAEALSLLATIYVRQDKLAESEPLIKRALEIRRQHLSSDHPDVAQTLSDYAKLLRKMQREQEAEIMYKEALLILSKIEEEQNEIDASETIESSGPEESELVEAAAQE
ncbi:MAG: tetratricopeptide repeat protein [Candidatus Melainabacteria bacterium]|nr:tetratricopeptide repeat protein [Candidatus Melainabacteria bacterium]